MPRHMVTTTDNPYNYFTQFDEWLAFDTRKGYDTLGFLARIARTSDDLPDEVNEDAIEAAVEEIVKYNVLGIYRKQADTTEQQLNNN